VPVLFINVCLSFVADGRVLVLKAWCSTSPSVSSHSVDEEKIRPVADFPCLAVIG